MVGHAEKCSEKYCELAGISEQQLKVVATPGLDDHQIPSEKFETKAVLACQLLAHCFKDIILCAHRKT